MKLKPKRGTFQNILNLWTLWATPSPWGSEAGRGAFKKRQHRRICQYAHHDGKQAKRSLLPTKVQHSIGGLHRCYFNLDQLSFTSILYTRIIHTCIVYTTTTYRSRKDNCTHFLRILNGWTFRIQISNKFEIEHHQFMIDWISIFEVKTLSPQHSTAIVTVFEYV